MENLAHLSAAALPSRSSSVFIPYLHLVRAPAVFSALGDPLAGLLIAGGRLTPTAAARLGGAAASLYLAGMALNDLADREEDARERPWRPIPSGAVNTRAAAAVGLGLLGLGVSAAYWAGARRTGVAVAGAVLAYDFGLKSTPVGPLAMGTCRALSLLMGAEAAASRLGRDAAGAAGLLSIYVAGLTLVARGETSRTGNQTALAGVVFAGSALLATLARGGWRSFPWVATVGALAGPTAVRAIRSPSPPNVGRAVGAMIRSIPALDAALIAPRSPVYAAALALPLLGLVRWGRTRISIN